MLDSGNHAFGEGYYHPESFGGQAVVLTADGAGVVYSVNPDDGKIVDHSIHGGTGKHIENKEHDFTDTKVTHPLGVRSK